MRLHKSDQARRTPSPNRTDLELKTIDLRLRGVGEATQRSRFVFLVMTIAAVTILVSLWNSTLAWDRGLAFPTVASTDNNTGVLTPDALLKIKENQGELTR